MAWGGVFPLRLLGKDDLIRIIRPRKPDAKVLFLVVVPLALAFCWKILTGMAFRAESALLVLGLLVTTFGNGFFEEMGWRGVYMKLFPDRDFFRIVWPAVWFGLWHVAPGSVSPNPKLPAMIAGAGLFGLYLGYLAQKTDTVWWRIVAHTLGGMIMVV